MEGGDAKRPAKTRPPQGGAGGNRRRPGASGKASAAAVTGAGSVPNSQGEYETACTPEQIAARGPRKPVNLALQGGGVHGAFAWGVLDRLLEDGRLAPDAISATSAGAMNAVVMAIGISEGGFDGARARLAHFWSEVARSARTWYPMGIGAWPGLGNHGSSWNGGYSLGYLMFDAVTRMWSPYQLNPFDINPLKDVLVKVVDFERLRACPHATRLFLSATNVRTSKIRVFVNAELTADAVMASACLPYIFKAVEIDGEHYWDGGFMGNPAIYPLIYRGASHDVIVVHINPITRDKVPMTAPEILDRMNEISFNSSLMREMRAIAFVTRLLDQKSLDDQRYRRMLIHSIRNDEAMSKFSIETKLDASWQLLTELRDLGRSAATSWLAENFENVGKRTTVDLEALYL